jgi:hypothetical protein
MGKPAVQIVGDNAFAYTGPVIWSRRDVTAPHWPAMKEALLRSVTEVLQQAIEESEVICGLKKETE